MGRLATSATVAAVALLALAGCGTPEPAAPTIDSTEAAAEYQPVMDDILATLTAAYPTVTWSTGDSSDRVLAGNSDDPCSLWLADQQADDLPGAAGGWSDVIDALNPTLERHGFSEITEEDSIDGGFTGISSRDATGAELRIVDKTSTEISLEIDVTDTGC